MIFLKNIFKSNKRNEEKTPPNNEKSTEFGLGEFDLNDFPEQDRSKSFYFHEYNKPDGEWVEIDEPICKIRIGEMSGFAFKSASVMASESGILEHTLKKGDLISNGNIFYKLHQKGKYVNENTTDNVEFKSYFLKGKSFSFQKWLVEDGSYVQKGSDIYEYSRSILANAQLTRLGGKPKDNELKHKAEKSGYIDLYLKTPSLHITENELMYVIRKNDKERINRKFINEPNIIKDEFTNSTIIKWEKVSSRFQISAGVKTKSDNLITDFLFSFNYIDNADQIVFHFDPKQIKPKQSDKVFFLFENGEQIQYELTENPVLSKNRLNEKIIEYKGLITKTELELFANSNFKKWKISLVSDKREILGGEIGGDDFYPTKNNIQIVIKKFASEYIDLVKETIPNYEPTELKQVKPEKENIADFCFVYLMHDTSNSYYKIGISNSPEYRERTLQSEKPTIEMIASKKFPVRKIAESIEKALHSTYSEKRLRGEWFELNDNDVEHIKETLK
ncbi:MAG: GIY-YIG nuclease family protein [Muricauda sp.]|nr:GIY-YIG nuclease family protein [Allomuricauda sp.]MBA4744258.1 GIY-YIG nuclease family protein [Allomuricauda sp.]